MKSQTVAVRFGARWRAWLRALSLGLGLGLGDAALASAQVAAPPSTPRITNRTIELAVGETRTLPATGVRTPRYQLV